MAASAPAIRAAATDSTPSAEAAEGTGAGPGRRDETGKPVLTGFVKFRISFRRLVKF